MRTPIIVANWKMYKTINDTTSFCDAFLPLVQDVKSVDMAICAPAIHLAYLREFFEDSVVGVGAQNIYPIDEGAYTGEISAYMLQDMGVQYVIIGHSERRELFGESNDLIREKLNSAYAHQLQPILCVGERLEQRENGETLQVCAGQLTDAVRDLTADQLSSLIVAYEPIWAIGTGKTATAADAEAVIGALRQTLRDQYGTVIADQVRIQYGGSVKPENIKELMAQPNIDGALVGGASLQPNSFAAIVRYQEEATV